jgi:hypothetical protein
MPYLLGKNTLTTDRIIGLMIPSRRKRIALRGWRMIWRACSWTEGEDTFATLGKGILLFPETTLEGI